MLLAVGHAIRTVNMCRQIPDRPFEVVGCGFHGAPHCVAPKSLESNQRNAMAELLTIVRRRGTDVVPLGQVNRHIPDVREVSEVSYFWNARRKNGTAHNSIPACLPIMSSAHETSKEILQPRWTQHQQKNAYDGR